MAESAAGIAEALAAYGADVSIASRNMEKLLEAKEKIKEKTGKDVTVYTVDALMRKASRHYTIRSSQTKVTLMYL